MPKPPFKSTKTVNGQVNAPMPPTSPTQKPNLRMYTSKATLRMNQKPFKIGAQNPNYIA